MVFKKSTVFLLFLFFNIIPLYAPSMVDCRIVASNTSICNPYGEKLLQAKESNLIHGGTKLIITKTLPKPKKRIVKVISVEDMTQNNDGVEESVRFRGSKKTRFKVNVIEKHATKKELDEKIESIKDEISELQAKVKAIDALVEQPENATYEVQKGDVLSKIAKKFGLEIKELAAVNGLGQNGIITVGQKLSLTFSQETADAFISGEYEVQEGETLLMVADKFHLDIESLATFNNLKSDETLVSYTELKLPLPAILEEKKREAAKQKRAKLDMVSGLGRHTLRVTATAYTSHANQTGGSPFIAAWGTRLHSGMKIIAVSNDMLRRYGMRNGSKVRIGGLPGYYTVRDKMSKRFKKRIDIYMGLDRRAALRWGRRSVMIYW